MFDPEYTRNFIELFIFCKKTKKILKSLQRHERKCKGTRMIIQKHITLEGEHKDIIYIEVAFQIPPR